MIRTEELTGFVGLSHLGIISSTCWASKCSPIIGFDIDEERINKLRFNKAPVDEPKLNDLLHDTSGRRSYSTDFSDLSKCRTVFITQDIKTDSDNSSDYISFYDLLDRVIPNLADNTVIVLMSQVSVGTCRALIDRIRAQRPDLSFDLVYMVETLIFGKAVERFLKPERIILGTALGEDGFMEKYRSFGNALNSFDVPVLTMKYESAELTKLAINLYLFNSITYANTLADLCEAYSADMNQIIPALRMDKRIGMYSYIQPSLGITGGNLERDMATLSKLEKAKGIKPGLVDLLIRLNDDRYKWLEKQLDRYLFSKISRPRIAIWGLAYKKDTDSTKNSISLKIINELSHKADFSAFDPIVRTIRDVNIVSFCNDRYNALNDAHCLIVLTDPDEFHELDIRELKSRMRRSLIIDCVNLYPSLHKGKDREDIEYVAIGR